MANKLLLSEAVEVIFDSNDKFHPLHGKKMFQIPFTGYYNQIDMLNAIATREDWLNKNGAKLDGQIFLHLEGDDSIELIANKL